MPFYLAVPSISWCRCTLLSRRYPSCSGSRFSLVLHVRKGRKTRGREARSKESYLLYGSTEEQGEEDEEKEGGRYAVKEGSGKHEGR